ncbi:uncharacterized protein LOC112184012 [Rosa chinensis]|uniref:uncharacterized protein LOC112184012 n=1 Tax=Rosa chinensis TaxID=74649 RepID=UPI000D0872EE|nr:uncharacterized protein LOC112184012 [Rosa chinensis]
MPPDLNFTHVVLIPKIKEVVSMSHLRPIALCNVIYKIASKVVANRLKSFLPALISPQQSAFVPNCLISDNTLVASKVAHYMHRLKRGQEGFLALKLDISKAYDRLEWSFLRKIMLKMGFASQWMELIMFFLSTVRYSFLINGNAKGFIDPQRGLRQGDPISPYLFLHCVEGLSTLISHAVSSGQWQGLRICDGLLPQDCYLIRQLLNIYEKASGQQVNLQKSNAVFNGTVLPHLRESMANILGVQVVDKHEKYLRIPTLVSRSRIDTFAYIKDNLSKKLTGWRSKLLSISAGREILIKVVAQAMPLYTMNYYLLPQSLIQEHCASRDILRAGIWRHIGNGTTTNIWVDPWLMGEDLSLYRSDRAVVVADLFLALRVWDTTLLSNLFPAHVVQNRARQGPRPTLYLQGLRPNLTYSGRAQNVISILWDRSTPEQKIFGCRILEEEPSNPNPSSALWKKLWNTPVLGNVKVCAWKATSNILPTRSRLSERGIDIDTQCPFCKEEVELSPLFMPYEIVSMQLVCSRNFWIWDEECKLATDIVPITMAFCLDSSITRLGVVFRNHEGVVLGGFRHTVMVSSSAQHAELLALLQGVQLAIDQNFTPVIVETDCMDLVHTISGSSLHQSELGFLIDDMRNMLHDALDAKVVFGSRQVNLVAHTLAQEAKVGQFGIDFFTNIPPSVEALILSYCNDVSSMN